ncbi:MAG: zinc finger protein [Candidatus Thalassarchaeaceae archaeon]|nr:zinc finger protein [Candidatus Thalassarchaeaceae archaeon]
MAFDAHIREISHEGGMLAPFTGSAPKLGQVMQLPGGKWVGKVDTVIGEVSAAVVHIIPFRDVESELLIGQPVEIAPPKERRDDRGRRDERSGIPMKDGDWNCPKCQNHNFAWRESCNRCEAPKGAGGGGGGGGDRRGGGGGGYRGGGGGGDRRGGDRRDNRGGDRGGDRRGSTGGDRRGGAGGDRGGFQRRDNSGNERRGGGDDNRPPRREYKGSNDRRPQRRDTRKSGGWGPKDKRGPRRS